MDNAFFRRQSTDDCARYCSTPCFSCHFTARTRLRCHCSESARLSCCPLPPKAPFPPCPGSRQHSPTTQDFPPANNDISIARHCCNMRLLVMFRTEDGSGVSFARDGGVSLWVPCPRLTHIRSAKPDSSLLDSRAAPAPRSASWLHVPICFSTQEFHSQHFFLHKEKSSTASKGLRPAGS
ncbi:Piso0_004774 [Millerozyma farinosa CBS 7064]|uniref:Piso0_004774 protein n=1 Tax=Pichia sorbitophila (strain ATCC MYA-4447 / BCRC 22081 / CBS 7064 / NBRC 10061 / NRRL Y-12695) TaxID=559304 RepID=G8Y3C4_PICSO|nr:Piso0_004774 [Millerozyma farinosa CBS 7064]